jgi:hypothetical protein
MIAAIAGWADVSSKTSTRFRCTRRAGTRANGGARAAPVRSTAFQELAAPLAAAVWLAERPLGARIADSVSGDQREYGGRPGARGIPRVGHVIYPGIDTVAYTPNAAERSPTPVFAYSGD